MKKNSLSDLLERKKVLIFDFDGTIADTSQIHDLAFKETISKFNITFDYQLIAGLKTYDAFKKIFHDNKIGFIEKDIHKLVKIKQEIARKNIAKKILPLPGVLQFLKWAKPKFELCLVTSGSRATVELALKTIDIYDYFYLKIFGDDVINAKPNPEGFNNVLRTLEIRPDEALVFEDSIAGFKAADNAGIDSFDARKNLWKQINKGQAIL